ncbi:hypothetical protein DM01DRAFT_1333542 [Hesseltinella vesiculosa]|uniref:Cyclin N-terminal domain-containing protein n=1 Tax=Hesseltinella vesiculosa TaxID=101127 RepID=A0A1X2GQB2_9FUNG|nr:hypothetical protein DM01DRAFT_1333542 [Hesseltinella vesiculosa]
MPPDNSEGNKHVICCGRRMFLASLMVAAKFLQDKNYRNRAWSHISGLPIKEINAAELAFLRLIKYDLFITKDTFDHWHQLLQSYMYRPQPSACYLSPAPSCLCFCPTPAVACSCPYSRHPSTSSALPSPPLTPPTPSSSHLINASLDLPSPFASPQFYFSFRPPCTIAYPSPPFEPGHKRPSDLSDHAHVKRHKQITLK